MVFIALSAYVCVQPDQWRWDWSGVNDDLGRPIPLNLPFLDDFRSQAVSFSNACTAAPGPAWPVYAGISQSV